MHVESMYYVDSLFFRNWEVEDRTSFLVYPVFYKKKYDHNVHSSCWTLEACLPTIFIVYNSVFLSGPVEI